MALLVNGVYKNRSDGDQFRVLCLFPQDDIVVVISLVKKDTVRFLYEVQNSTANYKYL